VCERSVQGAVERLEDLERRARIICRGLAAVDQPRLQVDRQVAVEDIGVEDVKRVVAPFWDKRQFVTAKKLLNRIEKVLGYAIAHG
jgi:hypothetical protein